METRTALWSSIDIPRTRGDGIEVVGSASKRIAHCRAGSMPALRLSVVDGNSLKARR